MSRLGTRPLPSGLDTRIVIRSCALVTAWPCAGAALDWLALLDGEQYTASFDSAAPLLRRIAGSASAWDQFARQARANLRASVQRRLVASAPDPDLPGAVLAAGFRVDRFRRSNRDRRPATHVHGMARCHVCHARLRTALSQRMRLESAGVTVMRLLRITGYGALIISAVALGLGWLAGLGGASNSTELFDASKATSLFAIAACLAARSDRKTAQ
jgi:hypothetical protein